jgi:tetratricopeptide (TPR) repeat protein
MRRPLPVLALAACASLAAAQPRVEPQGQAEPAGTHARPELRALLARADAAYRDRARAGELDAAREALAEAEKGAPDDFEVLWRLARLHFWLSDDPALGGGEKSRLGKRAWDYGERAIRADPERVEGWHYAAAGMGNYALGIGIFSALRQGIEKKFKDRLSRAERIAPDFERGAIQTAWGRFYMKLPWPKRDAKRSERALRAALAKNPDNVRAHVYLAELYREEGKPEKARVELRSAAADAPARYDEAEERRYRDVARHMLAEGDREEEPHDRGG